MLSARLIQLIQTHAESLAQETVDDVLTNEHTRSYGQFSQAELHPRVLKLYSHLGTWIGNPNEGPVRLEYEELGRVGHRRGIPLSEIIFTQMIIKKHLRRYIRDHGLIAFSGDRIAPNEMIPFELYGIQELNYLVGDFFDRALYYLTRGYEAQSKSSHKAV
jgi:hypothetical protein